MIPISDGIRVSQHVRKWVAVCANLQQFTAIATVADSANLSHCTVAVGVTLQSGSPG
jgi:hypothetical protein